MTLDLTKPIRHKVTKKPYKFLRKLATLSAYDIVVLSEGEKGEMVFVHSADALENMPESRWLNVYNATGAGVWPVWCHSRRIADTSLFSGRIAVIEDKQDGSPWIVHQLS